MIHSGTRASSSNLPPPIQGKVDKILTEFMGYVESIRNSRELRNAVVRSMLSCDSLILLDNESLHVIAKPQTAGVPSTTYFDASQITLTSQQALDAARWDFGIEDPFVISIPRSILEQETGERKPILEAIAISHVESEFQRVIKITSLIQINPLFGPASYAIDERLVFVLMPFKDELTTIYNSIIKPTVESYGLVCRRADDFKTNKVIMQDIWKAICEARFIIADLTELNPNVMYELGIAHTLGKETILINQIGGEEQSKFPFDITHIRRIEYDDNAVGGRKLVEDLSKTIEYLLNPPSIS